MDKEKIFSKIAPKDYNNELEQILEDKDFSEDVKNLLLSCVYKIEVAYNDYETVKKAVVSKKEYLEEILNIIKQKCNMIEIKKDEIQDEQENKKSRYIIDRIEGKITLWHPNEKIILYAIYELDDKQIYVDEKYCLVRTSLSELLNKGENMNRLEVLRDFNGWNWNTDACDIQNISINLIYQNLIELLGINFMEEWVHVESVQDYLKLAKEKIGQNFGEEKAEEIFSLINNISLIMCAKTNDKEREYLQEEKRDIEEEYARLDNKLGLLEEVTRKKRKALKEIRELDKIINDKKLLEQEYVSRNEKLPEYHKIFSMGHLKEILTKQRKKIVERIEEENRILDPSYYLEVKNKVREKLEILSFLDLEEEEIRKIVMEYTIKLEKLILECIKIKINDLDKKEKNEKREELINEIYHFRYYCFLNVNDAKRICDIEELQDQIIDIKKTLINKAEEIKCINKIAQNEKDFEVINVLFDTRIINLENIFVELKEEENIEAYIYDSDIFEKKIQININKDELIIKQNKKVKILL